MLKKVVNNLLDKLNPKSKRALKYWWKTYNKTKRSKVKKKALANLEWTVTRVAELDALLLAPERKVEVLAELQYNKNIYIYIIQFLYLINIFPFC